MAVHALVRELGELIARPGRFEAEFPAWAERCAAELARAPEPEAREVLEQLQDLIRENRALFEGESQSILDELVGPGKKNQQSASKARRYRDVGEL